MKKIDWKKVFTLSWKNLWIVVVLGFASILLHNAFYAIFGIEEAVFFIIVIFIIPIYFIIAAIYTIYLGNLYCISNNNKKNKRGK